MFSLWFTSDISEAKTIWSLLVRCWNCLIGVQFGWHLVTREAHSTWFTSSSLNHSMTSRALWMHTVCCHPWRRPSDQVRNVRLKVIVLNNSVLIYSDPTPLLRGQMVPFLLGKCPQLNNRATGPCYCQGQAFRSVALTQTKMQMSLLSLFHHFHTRQSMMGC